jgi:2-polyprenyl-3-methyl-5-hydroxy-6-metoxy-1,4-benzoquinol methylase/uncharacterized protein YbaR (Trm112 family)
MSIWWLKYLALPCCGTVPEIDSASFNAGNVERGILICRACDRRYEVREGIVRFSEAGSEVETFGLQWQRFAETQIDHLNGTQISAERLSLIAGGSLDFLKGAVVYDAGCGAGRFTAVAAQNGAFVIAADPAEGAIEACHRNTRAFERVVCVHASTERRPVQDASVDVALSIGVYQHTRHPLDYVRDFARAVRPGGSLVFWGYERRMRSLLHPKYVLRPLTCKIAPHRLLRYIEICAPVLLRISDAVRRLPGGRMLSRAVPIANYKGVLPLNAAQRLDWAVLDTLDWLSPRFDRPRTAADVSFVIRSLGYDVCRTLDDSVALLGVRRRSLQR